MTNQELYDKVVSHLRTQGKKSVDEHGCLYRGPNGTMCAAGCLIKDEVYNSALERYNVGADATKKALIASGVSQDQFHLVADMQNIHDNYDVCRWEKCFEVVTSVNGLTYTPAQGVK